MSFQQHGSADYKFAFDDVDAAAIAAAVGVKPQTLSLSYEPEFTAEATDENGEVAAVAVGQDKINFTLDGYVVDESLIKTGASFEYDGRYYIVMGRKIDTGNTAFKKGQLTGMSYANVTEPVTP
jgi:hypothetical protein